ncbi:TipAS antibiotic-recognition domain-containing protein [uncultured Nitratireductor sp.]|uniref:TipAS antibiotic-recognition domain-containing protein n=1 Tax=uncultured Nitratireductor sp. TaxID=520953 RepID=UPI002631B7F7|nr:TipAS antibiotic-recognition domain-containing protein [uncultured Nitratireductor sp.]
MRDLAGIEANLVKAMQDGTVPEARALDTALERHRTWVSDMWNRPCTPTAYAGLADIYESHPDVTQRYETLGKGFSRWLPATMRAGARRMPEA